MEITLDTMDYGLNVFRLIVTLDHQLIPSLLILPNTTIVLGFTFFIFI